MKNGNLITSIINSPSYRRMYVQYKIKVQHRWLPINLLKNLPEDIALELTILYNEEWKKYLRKKRQ